MNFKTWKLLVVKSDHALKEQIAAVLSDAGYEVSADSRDGMKGVLAFDPDAVILGADPPQLDCWDLLSEIKGSQHIYDIRVVMLSPGGSAERTSGAGSRGRRSTVTTLRLAGIILPLPHLVALMVPL
jgi:DNA-binding response OmpR family regulator